MAYTGRDGLTHQETRIDWDEKTKVSSAVITAKDAEVLRKEIVTYRKGLITRILSIPAELAGERYLDFVTRDFDKKKISWNKEMIQDEGMELEKLRDMAVILEKRADAFSNNDLSLKTPQVK